MKKLFLLLCLSTLFACAEPSSTDEKSPELGQVVLPIITSTPTHAYRLTGTASITQDGEEVLSVQLDQGNTPSVTTSYLQPGTYEVELQSPSLLRDGIAVPAQLTSANPQTFTITAGQTTPVAFSFSVAGDPIVFVCTYQTCGFPSFTVSVTEVPPS